MTSIEKNREFVRANREKLLNLYPEKFILVVDGAVVGSFDDYETATTQAIENYGADGEFYIEQLTLEEPINLVLSATHDSSHTVPAPTI